MKDKKLFSEKFRPYFMMHLKMVRWQIIGEIVVGVFWGWIWDTVDTRLVICATIMAIATSMREFVNLCSGMLYQRESYLYRSFPVSDFETVFTKIVTCATMPLSMLIPIPIVIYGIRGFVAVPMIMAGSLLVGGIILAAIGFGNSMRDSRAKKPSMFASAVAAILMLAAQAGLIVVFAKYVPMETGLKLLILTGVFLIEAAAFLWHNTRSLKYNYQV